MTTSKAGTYREEMEVQRFRHKKMRGEHRAVSPRLWRAFYVGSVDLQRHFLIRVAFVKENIGKHFILSLFSCGNVSTMAI